MTAIMENSTTSYSLKYSVTLVFVCAFAVYCNSLEGDFVYDDIRAILRNDDLRPSTPWINILNNDFWGTPLEHSGSHKSYRPVCVLSFRLNYMFGKTSPWGYHFVNNILHAVVSCLYTYVAWKLLQNNWVTLVSGLLFATHPVHTEAVSGIVGRADVGAAMFFLLAMICFMNAGPSAAALTYLPYLVCWTWLIATLFFASCSLFTKEQGVTVLAVCAAYEVLFGADANLTYPGSAIRKMHNCGSLLRIAMLCCFAVLILYIRSVVMGHSPPSFSPADNPAANDPHWLTRLLTFLYLPVFNFWLLICPLNLSYDWSQEAIPLVTSLSSSQNVLVFCFYASLVTIALCYVKFQRGQNDHGRFSDVRNKARVGFGNSSLGSGAGSVLTLNADGSDLCVLNSTVTGQSWRLTIFSLATMILPFLPATNMFFYVGFIVAERVLYIPSIGFCLLISNGVRLLMVSYPRYQRQILAVFGVLVVLFAGRTYDRNFVWRSSESLYRSGISTSPAKSYANLGNILKDQNKLKEAEEAYRAALSHRSNMGDTHYNLGLLMQDAKRYDEAVDFYKSAIVYRPRLAAAHLNLGITLNAMGETEKGLKVLLDAMNISDHGLKDPTTHGISLTNIRYNAGRILYDMKRYKEAIAMYLESIKIMPKSYEPQSIYNSLGQAYSALGEGEAAEMWYTKSLRAKADHYPAMLAYATHLGAQGKHADAERYFKQAISSKPALAEPYMHYAQYLTNQKNLHLAVNVMEKVLEFDSRNLHALAGIASAYRDQKLYKEAEKYQLLAVEVSPNVGIAFFLCLYTIFLSKMSLKLSVHVSAVSRTLEERFFILTLRCSYVIVLCRPLRRSISRQLRMNPSSVTLLRVNLSSSIHASSSLSR